MTFVFGKLADKKGTKFALVLALLIYCVVSVTAAGFAPLELEGEQDAERLTSNSNLMKQQIITH